MQIYMVGGAVRDALLGLLVQDRDWVVVGATPEILVTQGFLPVGKDFPVFLHPTTKEEYALARTERKTAPGYHGFCVHAAPDVTLEEDLARRDLTINSIAVSADHIKADGTFDKTLWQTPGVLVDPFGGRQDIANKVLRHVTPAFREDPVRILRVARLAARFADFTVAPETLQLMLEIVQSGEVDHLVAERVWQELAKGLMENTPSRMFTVLRDCGALARLLPEIDTGIRLMRVLDMAARLGAGLAVRFACLTHDLDKEKLESDPHFSDPHFSLKGVCERLRIPTECRELAEVVAREYGNIHRSGELGAAALVRLLERCDAFRKPQRFGDVLLACACAARGQLGLAESPYTQGPRLLAALSAAQRVATHLIAEQAIIAGASGKNTGQLIHLARVEAVNASL
nr:multifunctional CCA addition/repair protein [Rhodoferax sp.]